MSVTETEDKRWHSLYRMSGMAAMLISVLLVGEVIVYARYPRPNSVAEHFALFQQSRFIGLLTLDLLGMVSYLLFIPFMLALYIALRQARQATMAVATVLFIVGIADFFATNTAFSVLTLSDQYAAATTVADRARLLAAGETMFTIFNENAFLTSYVIVSASWLMVGMAMLGSRLFSRMTAYAGMLAGGAGILAVLLEHTPGSDFVFKLSIALYFAAIVFLLIWVVLCGLRLLRLSRQA